MLGAKILRENLPASMIPAALSAIIQHPDNAGEAIEQMDRADQQERSESTALADYASFAPVLAIEESPPSFTSLGGKAITIGATIAFLTVTGTSPALLIIAPVGIIIVFAAEGIGLGLRERLQRLIGGGG